MLQSIAVTPVNTSLPVGETEQFTATGTLSDKSTEDLTSQASWKSSDITWATINSTGLATAVGQGPVTISATLDGITGSTGLTVTAAVLQSIAVTPASPTISKGQTQQFTATGTLSDKSTEDLTSEVTWSSGTAATASISKSGLATALATGTSKISASFDGITGSTVLTVSAAVLQSIAVTPVNTSLPVGETEQFTATGTLSDKSTEDLTSQVSWKSSDITWATINSTGLATAVGQGPVTISAALDGITGSTGLTVTAAVLQSIAVTPASPTISKGQTQQFTATGTLSDKTTEDLTSEVTWTSGTAATASITATGLATGLATGTTTISAKLDAITGSTVLTVSAAALESIAVTPGNPTIAKGTTQQFTATGTLSDGTTEDLSSAAAWSSSKSTIASISATGLATALATGTTTISAKFDGISGSAKLTVSAAVLESIAVTPANTTIVAGSTQQFTATGTLSDNSTEDLTSEVTWASGTPATATISETGLATSLAAGTSTISAKFEGFTGSTVLTVSSQELSPMAVKDNSAAGYLQYGVWSAATGGYGGSYSVANPTTSSSASALWQVVLPAGSYDIWATWVSAGTNASNSTYSVFDGFNKLGAPEVNQQLAPGGGQFGGVSWMKLGTFTVTNGRLTVALSASGANGNVVADGILVVPSVAPATAALAAAASAGPMSSVPSGPLGTVSASGPSPAGPVANFTAPAAVSVPVATSIGTTVPATSAAVNDANVSSTDGSASKSAHGKNLKLAERALRKIQAKQRQQAHEALVERLARERIASAKHSTRHHAK